VRIKYRVIEFKAYPYFWELARDGKKMFDIRLINNKDPRFRSLVHLHKNPLNWLVKLTNTETGGALYFHLGMVGRVPMNPGWMILHFGDHIKEE